ncbi:MAG TPA: hypothetical protein VIT42_06495 [Microlunatus sp.]
MNTAIVRRGGWAGLVAAVLLVLSTVVSQIAPIGTIYRSPSAYLHQVLLLLAYAAILVAVLGLHARHRGQPRYGRLGGVGTVMTLIGYGAVALIVGIGIVMGSRVLNEVRIGAAVVLLIGSVLLGIALLRARLLPWWCGVLLIVAFPLGDVANGVFAGAEGLLLGLLWGLVGAALLKPVETAVEPVISSRSP